MRGRDLGHSLTVLHCLTDSGVLHLWDENENAELKNKKEKCNIMDNLKCADDMHTVCTRAYKHFSSGRLYTD